MNNNIEIPPFYINQEVVAIRDHSQGKFKKGDEFIVRAIGKERWCKCRNGWYVDVGKTQLSELGFTCTVCGHIIYAKSLSVLYAASSFAPKLEIHAFISMKELAEQGLLAISGN